MFTGIVQECARVKARAERPGGLRLDIQSTLPQIPDWNLGDSIAVSGVCLTLVEKVQESPASWTLGFDVSQESLGRTYLGALRPGDPVHLEPALRVGDPLGGHWVSGHVEGLGALQKIEKQQDFHIFTFEVSGSTRAEVAPYLVEKGSVAVDGVSLTVNAVWDSAEKTCFQVTCVPHTLALTRLGSLPIGARVHLEPDLLAKYAARSSSFLGINIHDSEAR